MKKRGFWREKKGIISDYLPWILIGIAVLAIVTGTILILKEKGIILVDQISDLSPAR